MSEQITQSNSSEVPVNATQLMAELEAKGAHIGEAYYPGGSIVRDRNAMTPLGSENSGSISVRDQITPEGWVPKSTGHASASSKIESTFVSYRGDITPQKYGVEPQVTRQNIDPVTGESTNYSHKFKDPQKAGQLIAKLANSRIEKTIKVQENGEDKKAA